MIGICNLANLLCAFVGSLSLTFCFSRLIASKNSLGLLSLNSTDNFSFIPVVSSKVGIPALWCEFYPKQNESFRVQFDFDSEEEAAKCFKDITSGKKRPFDFIKNYI